MANPKTVNFQFSAAIEHYWKLSDKVARTLRLGGVMVAAFVLYIVFSFVMAIPVVGWVFGSIGLLATLVAVLLLAAYVMGYRFEVVKAVAEGKKVEKIPALFDYQKRFRHGIKLMLASFIYTLPVGFVYGALFIGMLVIAGALSNQTAHDANVLGGIMAVVFVFVTLAAILVQMVYQHALELALTRQYYRTPSFNALLQVSEMWEAIQENFLAIVSYTGVTFAVQIVFAVVLMLCYLLVFLCIGIFVLPVVLAVYYVFMIHYKADLIGQFIAQTEGTKN